MERGGATVNYFVLLLVIVVGVAGGNLLSHWASGQIDAYLSEKSAGKPAKTGRAGATPEPSTSRIPMPGDLMRMQQEQTREQRRRDRDGVRLGQACDEWRQANTQLSTATTSAEMKKHCGLYERYVQDGVLPAKR